MAEAWAGGWSSIAEGPGIPGTEIERVECPVHGDTWAFGPNNEIGGCMEPAPPGGKRDLWGDCGEDPVRVTYVLKGAS